MEYSFLPWLAFLCIEETHGGDSMEPGWAGRGCGSMVRWSSDRQAYLVLLKSRSDVDHTPNGVPPPFAPEVGVLFSARSEHRPRTSNVTDTGEQSSSGLDPRPTIPPGGPPLRPCHRLKKESHDRAIASLPMPSAKGGSQQEGSEAEERILSRRSTYLLQSEHLVAQATRTPSLGSLHW